MSDRPTWTYDGSVSWLDHVQQADQVLRDAIRDVGEAVTVLAREEPYAHPWYLRTQGRISIAAEPGVRFAPKGKDQPIFTIFSAEQQSPPVGIMELRGLQIFGGAVSITRGHAHIDDCLVSGFLPDGTIGGRGDSGGDTGIFASHSFGEPKYVWLRKTKVKGRGSHGTYLDATVVVDEEGEYSSADPNKKDDRAGGFDAFRSMSDVFLSRDSTFATIDDDPETPDGYASYCLGGVSAQRARIIRPTFRRTGPPRGGAPYMVGVRCRQSWGGANKVWLGDGPLPPGHFRIKSRPGWAFCSPFLTDEHGEAIMPWTRNPYYYSPEPWLAGRAAGIDTLEQLLRNPHTFPWILEDGVWENDGPGAVGVLAEGTAPVEPKNARGALHEPPRTKQTDPPDVDQDDYLPRPKEWFERSFVVNVRPSFRSRNDEAKRFVPYVARDAAEFVFRRTGKALIPVTGRELSSPDTRVRVFQLDEASTLWPSDLPGDVFEREALDGFAAVFPDYRPAAPERRIATVQRRRADRA